MTRVEMLIVVLAVVAFLTAFLVLVAFKQKTPLPKPGGRPQKPTTTSGGDGPVKPEV